MVGVRARTIAHGSYHERLVPSARKKELASCQRDTTTLPPPPCSWPQNPMLLRATPGTGMKIRGIRQVSDAPGYYRRDVFPCKSCPDALPLNSGSEGRGQTLLVDFESSLFIGTMLMRLKDAPPTTEQEKCHLNRSNNYFDGKKRKYHVVVRGRFKEANIPMSEICTGQLFDRPAKGLPSRWMVNGVIKLFMTISPQLEAEIDGERPRFLMPILGQAHTVVVDRDDKTSNLRGKRSASFNTAISSNSSISSCSTSGSSQANNDFEDELIEPQANDPRSVLYRISNSNDVSAKTEAKCRSVRKKSFNYLAAARALEPTFDTDCEYTFEFIQHLLYADADDFVLTGTGLGRVGLCNKLNGQPVKSMATRKSRDMLQSTLWSFDLWHAALYPDALAAAQAKSGR